jgi:histidinol dehydrogenase
MLLKKFDVNTAQGTILKRLPPDEMPVTESVLKRIFELFGERLLPAQAVDRILKDVRKRGDQALLEWTKTLDQVILDQIAIPDEVIPRALLSITSNQRRSLELAAERVRLFHEKQPVHSWLTQSMGGTLGQLVRPIQRIGLYIPSGSAPLPSSVLMSAIPAKVAGVKEIVLVAPPDRNTGSIDTMILAAAALLDIHEIYSFGGAQAIAALAYGTETIRPVDKIFGPGNLFVTLAKKQVYGTVGIDSLAGPTETMVIADEYANPEWVAADLLAQAEHDVLASSILISTSPKLIEAVQAAVEVQIIQRSRSAIIKDALANRSGAILVNTLEEAVQIANTYGSEHLCLSVQDPWELSEKVTCAGGIFFGENSFEVLGDYVAGPSHVMPTGGSARFASPLNVLDFVHIISLIALNEETTRRIAPSAAEIARAERLDAHANAAEVRL